MDKSFIRKIVKVSKEKLKKVKAVIVTKTGDKK